MTGIIAASRDFILSLSEKWPYEIGTTDSWHGIERTWAVVIVKSAREISEL